MPQMNPIYWTTLFLIFTLILILTFAVNYFFKYNLPLYSKKTFNKIFNWKW